MNVFSRSYLCSNVRYRIEGAPVAFYHSYCQRCRKTNCINHASNVREEYPK